MRYIKVVLLVLVFFFFAIFIAQNHSLLGQSVSFRLNLLVVTPLESIPMPLYFVLLITLILGALVCVLFLAGDRIKMSFALYKANKRINVLEQEVNSLRALPIADKKYKASVEEPYSEPGKPNPVSSALSSSAGSDSAPPLPDSGKPDSEKTSEEDSDSVAKL